MNKLEPNKGLKVFDIRWSTDTAGPSPDNNMRTELFLLGCKKANDGNPCPGCFNTVTWDNNKARHSYDPIEVADRINGLAPNKYITISGGEPTDQIECLIPLCKRLKEHGFHIMMYTWRDLVKAMKCNYEYIDISNVPNYIGRLDLAINDLLKYLDIVVDGQFIKEECLYQQELGDGMLSSIGSGNQIIWDIKSRNEFKHKKKSVKVLSGKHMRDLIGLYIKPDTNDLVYITKE